jgi:hypothetical protein
VRRFLFVLNLRSAAASAEQLSLWKLRVL